MKKAFYLSSVCSFLLVSPAFSAQLNINSNQTVSDAAVYSTPGGNGIIASSGNASPYTVTLQGKVTADNSANGMVVNNNSKVDFVTQSDTGDYLFEAKNNASSTLASASTSTINDSVSSFTSTGTNGIIASSGTVNFTDINVDASSNTVSATASALANADGASASASATGNVAGINAQNGAVVNFVGNGDNTLKTNNNSGTYSSSASVGESSPGVPYVGATASASAGGNVIGMSSTGGAEINITGMDVEANNNTSTGASSGMVSGIYANGGDINIKSDDDKTNTLKTNDNYEAGIRADSGNINIKNMDIEANDNLIGIYATGGNINIEGKDIDTRLGEAKNTLTLNDNTYLGIDVAGGNVSINNMDVKSQGTRIIQISNGSFTLNNSNLSSTDDGELLVYNGGVVDINHTNITGRIYNNTSSMLELKNGSWWTPPTDFAIRNLALTDSTIDLRSKNADNSLTLVNAFAGDNGNIHMNMDVGSSNANDKIIVANGAHASGTTYLNMHNISDLTLLTSGEGLKLVEGQGSAVIDDGAFQLAGGMWDEGAYEYILNPGSGNSLYLATNGQLSNLARTIGNAADISMLMAKTGSNELRKRLGELRDNSYCDDNGLWVRAYGKMATVDDLISTDVDMYGVEAGYDYSVYVDNYQRIYLGLMAGYLSTSNIDTDQSNGYKGEGDGDAPSIGVYATWITQDGWFADAALRSFWTSLDMTSFSSTGLPIDYSPDRQITMATLEGGKQFEYRTSDLTSWLFEPKAELTYGYAPSTDFRTSNGYMAYYDTTSSIITKLSMMVAYNKHYYDKDLIIQPFVQVGVFQEWDGKTNVKFAGAEYESDMGGTGFEIGGGINAQLNTQTAMYADIMYEKSSVIDGISANLGLRRTW